MTTEHDDAAAERASAARRRYHVGAMKSAQAQFEGVDARACSEPVRLGTPLRDALDPQPEVHTVHLGTPLRDAAVDPRPGDFLPPTNAGEPGELGNPHGPHVVAPGLPELQEKRSGPWPPSS